MEIDERKVLISEINMDSDLSILRDGYIYTYKKQQDCPEFSDSVETNIISNDSAQQFPVTR